MKAAMMLMLSVMLSLGLSSARAADAHDHGAQAGKAQSLGGGKTCDKCNKHKGNAKGGMMDGCCCDGMMDKMGTMSGSKQGGMDMMNMDHDAMQERMAKMEARMDKMQAMMDQMAKAQMPAAK